MCAINSFSRRHHLRKVPAYISFDYEHDNILKEFVIEQSKKDYSRFQVTDHSIKIEVKGDWIAEAEKRIIRSEVVLVIVGRHSHSAQGVLKEVELGRKHGKKIVQLIGYKDADPTPVPNAGRLYRWTHDNLATIFQ